MDTVKLCGSSDLSEAPRFPLAAIQTNMMTSRQLYQCNNLDFPMSNLALQATKIKIL